MANCPLLGMKPCRKDKCEWWMYVHGQHPQTGEQLAEGMCAIKATAIGTFESARNAQRTEAAVESFRNENSEVNHTALSALKAISGAVAQEQLAAPHSAPKLINGNSQ